jgi:hypothetical protein
MPNRIERNLPPQPDWGFALLAKESLPGQLGCNAPIPRVGSTPDPLHARPKTTPRSLVPLGIIRAVHVPFSDQGVNFGNREGLGACGNLRLRTAGAVTRLGGTCLPVGLSDHNHSS